MFAKILITDDDQVNTKLVTEILSQQQLYMVDVVSSVDEALFQLSNNNYDLVLSDIVMPNKDGFELAKEVKRLHPNTNVILMTSSTEKDWIERAFKAGADDFINKPISKVELIMRVKNLLKIKQTENYLNVALKELTTKITELQKLVVTDSLTELYNHKYIIERLDSELSEAERFNTPLSIVMFDIDHFKRVNDTFGHPAGDEVLLTIAQTIKKHSREYDIVARYGGEEFLVILPNTSVRCATKFAERIRKEVKELKWSSYDMTLTISGGIAEFYTGVNPADLIIRADKMLYVAKRTGRDKIVLYKEELLFS
jgi:diguanylate cyclase (GGDEF)-like protein